MKDILTITLNPALDLAASVDRVVPDRKLYTTKPRVDPGGGGVNVARMIHKLGGEVTALVAISGATGTRLTDLLTAEGVVTLPVHMPGETRQSLAVTDASSGAQYRFSLPGEMLGPDDGSRLLAAIADAAPQNGLVVLSGGVAPGLGDDFPERVQAAIAPRTDRLIVDTSKAALMRLVAQPVSPVHILRIDQKEAAQAANHEMDTIADSVSFASGLVARGVARMVVTGRGAEGSVMVTQEAHFLSRSATVPVRSKIGAGDALVGAMTLALAQGDPTDQALRWGVAAASATVATEGTALCSRAEVEALIHQCDVSEI
ncbi:1-phosphofructokinase family hexose kinase [uncultured Tateyamaria sp.]|uniref:1-phosphofructokinase family hexose kinase n=1 Tax=uncultured Tateyamaria sp. TaxID=455651 RepID=UPI00261CD34E|nr:1-phosphofructokinase family hexose kinase [uncultured Tateyamaria sp.]